MDSNLDISFWRVYFGWGVFLSGLSAAPKDKRCGYPNQYGGAQSIFLVSHIWANYNHSWIFVFDEPVTATGMVSRKQLGSGAAYMSLLCSRILCALHPPRH